MTDISFRNDCNSALADDDLDLVGGGASWQGIIGGAAAGVGLVAATIAFAPAVATGASVGFVASMIGGSTVAAGGAGSMVGGIVDLIKGN